MKTDYTRFAFSIFIILLVTWILSCSGWSGKKTEATPLKSEKPSENKKTYKIILKSPTDDASFKLNDAITLILEPESKERIPDSVIISFDGRQVAKVYPGKWEYTIPSSYTTTTGRKALKAIAYKDGQQQNSITRFMIIYSDMVPAKQGYKIIRSYPHDRNAFTQGLFFDKGLLYEGTGQETGSSLREVELETGKVVRQHNIDDSLFGEGITLYRDRIFQITWRNKVGFVYEKPTFKQISKFYYPTEGWGLTTMGDKIVMSDGTNILYFIEPDGFTVVSRVEVYDNKMKVDSLNELELINGEIWANIWMNNHIARIDPLTGKVLAYIDLNGILPDSEKDYNTDCLNGIAWDQSGKRIFVTGKKWPKLYEIKVTE
jgi:glutaminyl-peptide cyclotransferase